MIDVKFSNRVEQPQVEESPELFWAEQKLCEAAKIAIGVNFL